MASMENERLLCCFNCTVFLHFLINLNVCVCVSVTVCVCVCACVRVCVCVGVKGLDEAIYNDEVPVAKRSLCRIEKRGRRREGGEQG